jgi:uracil-DNA glycosylase
MTLDERRAALDAIAAETRTCQRCPLCRSGTQAVPGEGPPDAALLFIGEGPGFHEDRQGRPFVGPAGQLLTDLLAGIDLQRDQVFITNMVKHRPPGNRDPEPDELAACQTFLDRQIELVNPRVIVTLGRFAMERFMPGARISQVHGKPRRIGTRTFVPIIHPAAALHNGSWREPLSADFAALGRLLTETAARAATTMGPQDPPDEPPLEQLSLF